MAECHADMVAVAGATDDVELFLKLRNVGDTRAASSVRAPATRVSGKNPRFPKYRANVRGCFFMVMW